MSDKELISSNQMIVSVEELKEKGLSLYKINQLVEQGQWSQLKKLALFYCCFSYYECIFAVL